MDIEKIIKPFFQEIEKYNDYLIEMNSSLKNVNTNELSETINKYYSTIELNLSDYNKKREEKLLLEKKEKIYKEGIQFLDNKSFYQALCIFKSINDYKDVNEKINLCEKELDNLLIEVQSLIKCNNYLDAINILENGLFDYINSNGLLHKYKKNFRIFFRKYKFKKRFEKLKNSLKNSFKSKNTTDVTKKETKKNKLIDLIKEKTNLIKINKKKVITFIICIVIVFFIISSIIFCIQNKIDETISLINDYNFTEAKKTIKSIKHKNSKELYNLSTAGELLNDGNYEDAIKLIIEAGGQITVDYHNGNVTYKYKQITDSNYDLNYEPYKAHYIFLYWSISSFSLSINENSYHFKINLKANYDPMTYNITYDLKGGENNYNPTCYTYLDYIKLTSPTRENYSFRGWMDEEGEIIKYINMYSEKDYFLTATWEPKLYRIFYKLDEGINSTLNPNFYDITKEVIFYQPKREGYIFLGWYDSYGNKIEKIETGSSGDITLYAKWELE